MGLDREMYDDGGFSGATMERPAFQRLLKDVKCMLSGNRVHRANGKSGKEPSVLTGILFDARGGRMSPTHATKRGTRYRYYISRSLLGGSTKAGTDGQRIPAAALESLVVRRIRDWLAESASDDHRS